MATSRELAQIISYALDYPHETISTHLANIRLAGMITRKGYGRGAARMIPLDAARLMLACAGSLQSKDSVETAKAFGALKPAGVLMPRDATTDDSTDALDATFECAMARELEAFFQRHKSYRLDDPEKLFAFFAGYRRGDPAIRLFLGNPGSEAAKIRAAVFRRISDEPKGGLESSRETSFSNAAEFLWKEFADRNKPISSSYAYQVEADFPRMTRVHLIYPEAVAIVAMLLHDDRAIEKLEWRRESLRRDAELRQRELEARFGKRRKEPE